jgi:membrane protein
MNAPADPRPAAPRRRGVVPEGRAEARELGREARFPGDIPWRGWKQVLRRTWREMLSDRISLVAAGCAFWATLSLFPAISMLISLYGLAFNPETVEPQLQTIRHLLPAPAFEMISDRVRTLVSQGGTTLGFSLIISVAFTLYSASTGIKSLLSALNMAYEETERRSFLKFQMVGLLMTLGAILAAIVGLLVLVFLPVVISFLGLSGHTKGLVHAGSFIVLLAFVLFWLSVLYRFGPSRRAAKWHWITPGSVAATVLWLVASYLFSFYVQNFASYNATYGPLDTVAGIMMWFWVSAYAVLMGAELNAELELQTAEDTTEGEPKPMGKRGAFVADHVAED